MKTNQEIAYEVIQGLWGNGNERIARLCEAGYDATAVQSIVNALLSCTQVVENSIQINESEPTVEEGLPILEIEFDTTKYSGLSIGLVI